MNSTREQELPPLDLGSNHMDSNILVTIFITIIYIYISREREREILFLI